MPSPLRLSAVEVMKPVMPSARRCTSIGSRSSGETLFQRTLPASKPTERAKIGKICRPPSNSGAASVLPSSIFGSVIGPSARTVQQAGD